MKEQEVFDMFKRIDTKLDRIAECRIEDLELINTKISKHEVDIVLKEDRNVYRWMASGCAVALIFLFGYTVAMKADISKIQTSIISLHTNVPTVVDMVKETKEEGK